MFQRVANAAFNDEHFSNGCFFIRTVSKVFGNGFFEFVFMRFNGLAELLNIGFALAPRWVRTRIK